MKCPVSVPGHFQRRTAMIAAYATDLQISNGSVSASRKFFSRDCDVHWHEFYEIEYIISGNGTYSINEKVYPISPGMIFFMTPTDFHSVENADAQMFNVMFSEKLITTSQLMWLTGHNTPRAFLLPEDLRPFFMTMLDEIVKHQEDTAYVSALLNCLLYKLTKILPCSNPSGQSSLAQKMHFFIINHFRSHITLEDVAAYVGLTPAYVSGVFKKEMNRNFKKYLNDLRFSYARNLLLNTDLSVTQICSESGFEDYPNFIRRFKEHFGMTPTMLRSSGK